MIPTLASLNIAKENWRPQQHETVAWLKDDARKGVCITEQPTGCHPEGQMIRMANGTLMNVVDIKVGSKLLGIHNGTRTVTQLLSGMGGMWRVLLNNGLSFIGNTFHVLYLKDEDDVEITIPIGTYLELGKYVTYRWRAILNDDTRHKFTIEWLPGDYYYGFELDGDGLYVLDNGIITHNSGKSTVAIALNDGTDINKQTIILTHTRSLQRQYRDDFKDCFIQYGRQNYPCTSSENPLLQPTADECIFADNTHKCYMLRMEQCPYYSARETSLASPRVALNYAYWFTLGRLYNPYWLVLDEAHALSDIVLDHTGLTIDAQTCANWRLPRIPDFPDPEMAIFNQGASAITLAGEWLHQCASIMKSAADNAMYTLRRARQSHAPEIARRMRAAFKLSRKFAAGADSISTNNGAHWFINSIPGKSVTLKPLTARYDFKNFFMRHVNQMGTPSKLLLMSATIGNMDIFANELGLQDWDGRVVKNLWPKESRPIHILDAPSMGRANTTRDPLAFEKQADVIAKAILSQPKDWCGLILVSRKTETVALARRLALRGLAERIFPMVNEDLSYKPTDQQVADWEARKERVPNSIGISASLFTGYDGRAEKILIVAKIPWDYLGDPYERARMQYDTKMFLWRAACTLEQGLGRTRRGNAVDYDTADCVRGFVAIADDDYRRVMSYLSDNIKESLVEG